MAGGGDDQYSAPPARALTLRALVTGAAGFIGSTLVDRLLTDGHQVVGIDNFRTGISANLEHACVQLQRRERTSIYIGADRHSGSGTDCIVAGANPHVIFHLAAQVDVDTSVSDPQFDARSNVLGTINLCEASRIAGVRRIVYAASGESRYGAQACLPVDEDSHVDPLSPHAVAKLAGEMYLRAYAEMYGLAPICLALANVYGPRQSPHGAAGVIAVLGSAMITGRTFAVYGDVAAAHDYVYVDDVVDAFMRAGCASIETTGTYNIGTGQHITATEVQGLIAAVLDGWSPQSFAADRDELHSITLNATKAEKDLDWKAAVDLAEGIRRTMQWLCATLEPEPSALMGA
jgi:UDP-glucose 4-epimerase